VLFDRVLAPLFISRRLIGAWKAQMGCGQSKSKTIKMTVKRNNVYGLRRIRMSSTGQQ
jgi:hypothetical protein